MEYEAVEMARERCGWWAKLTECGEWLYENRLSMTLKGAGMEVKNGAGKRLERDNMKAREIHGESNAWSAAQRWKEPKR